MEPAPQPERRAAASTMASSLRPNFARPGPHETRHWEHLTGGADSGADREECCICMESFDRRAGIECDAAPDNRHFACDECFAGCWVRIDVASEETFPAADGSKACFGYRCRGSSSFSLAQIEAHLPAEEYLKYKITAEVIAVFTQKFSPRDGSAEVLDAVPRSGSGSGSGFELEPQPQPLSSTAAARFRSMLLDIGIRPDNILDKVKLQCRNCQHEKKAGISDGIAYLQNPNHHVKCSECGHTMWAHDPDGKWKGIADKARALERSAELARGDSDLRREVADALGTETNEDPAAAAVQSFRRSEGASAMAVAAGRISPRDTDLHQQLTLSAPVEVLTPRAGLEAKPRSGSGRSRQEPEPEPEPQPQPEPDDALDVPDWEPALRAELAALKKPKLNKRARDAGVDADTIDELWDEADDAKTAVIELTVAALRAVADPAVVPPRDQLEDLRVTVAAQMAQMAAIQDEADQKLQAAEEELQRVSLAAAAVSEMPTPPSVRWAPLLRAATGPERRQAFQTQLDKWHSGRWVIAEQELGSGSSGVVFRSSDARMGKVQVAIKFSYSDEPRKLEREAILMQVLAHERICRLYENPCVSEDGQLFGMVLELLEKGTLADRIKASQDGRIREFEVIQMGFDVLAALLFMHEKKVIHRDIKPSNIMMTEVDDRLVFKLIDFSISAVEQDARADVSNTLQTSTTNLRGQLGTPHYMSPEQFDEDVVVSPQTDLWSLGVVMFECLSGKLPFAAKEHNRNKITQSVMNKQAPEISDVITDEVGVVSKGMSAFISYALEKDLTQRFQTAAEMTKALEETLRASSDDQFGLFISYRVWCDKPFAEALYTAGSKCQLRAGRENRMKVYLDKVQMVDGERFDINFAKGLAGSIVFSPLLSVKCLQTSIKLLTEGKEDFVLMEWIMALELNQRKIVKAIFPITVEQQEKGKKDGEKDGEAGRYSQSFVEELRSGKVAGQDLPDVVSTQSIAKAKEFLSMLDPPVELSEELTVKAIVLKLLNFQAVFLHFENDAIDSLDDVQLLRVDSTHGTRAKEIKQKYAAQTCAERIAFMVNEHAESLPDSDGYDTAEEEPDLTTRGATWPPLSTSALAATRSAGASKPSTDLLSRNATKRAGELTEEELRGLADEKRRLRIETQERIKQECYAGEANWGTNALSLQPLESRQQTGSLELSQQTMIASQTKDVEAKVAALPAGQFITLLPKAQEAGIVFKSRKQKHPDYGVWELVGGAPLVDCWPRVMFTKDRTWACAEEQAELQEGCTLISIDWQPITTFAAFKQSLAVRKRPEDGGDPFIVLVWARPSQHSSAAKDQFAAHMDRPMTDAEERLAWEGGLFASFVDKGFDQPFAPASHTAVALRDFVEVAMVVPEDEDDDRRARRAFYMSTGKVLSDSTLAPSISVYRNAADFLEDLKVFLRQDGLSQDSVRTFCETPLELGPEHSDPDGARLELAQRLSVKPELEPEPETRTLGEIANLKADEKENEPTAIALKQKPTLRTWPTRFVRIKDKSLLVFENQDDYNEWDQQQGGHVAAADQEVERATSIADLTGCSIVKGVECFTFGGDYFKMSVFSPNLHNPELPGFNQRNDKEAFFAFQAKYDCERFVAAVSVVLFATLDLNLKDVSDSLVGSFVGSFAQATNIAAGRKWNEPAEDQVVEP